MELKLSPLPSPSVYRERGLNEPPSLMPEPTPTPSTLTQPQLQGIPGYLEDAKDAAIKGATDVIKDVLTGPFGGLPTPTLPTLPGLPGLPSSSELNDRFNQWGLFVFFGVIVLIGIGSLLLPDSAKSAITQLAGAVVTKGKSATAKAASTAS